VAAIYLLGLDNPFSSFDDQPKNIIPVARVVELPDKDRDRVRHAGQQEKEEQKTYTSCPGGGTGRHAGLKIL